MWIVFIIIIGILISMLEYSRYMYIIDYDILELQVYLPSEDNFYCCLSVCSTVYQEEMIKSNCMVEVEFLLSFPTKKWFLWVDVCRWGA